MADYAVVEFEDSGTVAVIPTTWFTDVEENECMWPRTSSSNVLHRLVKTKEKPNGQQSHWKRYRVRVLGKAKGYDRACEKLKIAEETSDLQTDSDMQSPSDKKRRRKKSRKLLESLDSNSESSSGEEVGDTFAAGFTEVPVPDAPVLIEQREEVSSPGPRPATARDEPQPTVSVLQPVELAPQLGAERRAMQNERTFLLSEEIVRKIFRNQENIKESLKVINAQIQAFCRSKHPVEEVVLPAQFSFPLQSLDDLDDAEEKLGEAAQVDRLVSVLGDLGGRSLEECVRRVMTHIMSNDLSLLLNMVGRNGKRAFGSTKLFDVVYRSIKRNIVCSAVNKKDIERGVLKWLLGGRDRDGKRAIRAAQAAQARAGPSHANDSSQH